ncbi:MAG: hypothetical protein KF898_04785 [Parachlamydiales bacterium]|nr:hypothetical protein [Candidatus Acheromyda pituitae]
MSKFEILIASLPYRERLVAEIYYDNMYWVQISQEEGGLVVQFYSHPTEKYWIFPFEEALKILEEAKNKLLEL